MTQTPITELDFFQIKEQLKAYLRGQSRYKDYDFEGSNMSVLLDILAYNTYQNNFYTNMAVSEMFLDSALQESSVLSHAKELNYLPRSTISARAEINVVITSSTTVGSTFSIPANTKFSTSYNGKVYNFFTDQNYIATRQGQTNNFSIACMPIYEGEIVTEKFYLTSGKTVLPLSNPNIDISSIKVKVNNGTQEYLFRSNIFGVEATDKVFYIEPTTNGYYGISFGKNIFGTEPAFNEDISVTYRVASGAAANGSNKFSTSFAQSVVVTTFSPATGGSDKESIESIKYFAPKSIQNQERAVTAKDYETLLRQQFGSSIIKSVSVYGGDEMEPPRYGKVAISINPYEGTTISDGFKTSVISYLSDKTPLPIKPIFVDPDFLYAKLDLIVYYSRQLTSKTTGELETLIRATIQNYSKTYLSDFGTTLQLSRLSKMIDDSDIGILSNTMEANPIIDYSPPANYFQNPQFKFETSLIAPYAFNENESIDKYIPAIKSSSYLYNGSSVFFQDDGKGNIITLSSNVQKIQVLNPVVGTVDYTSGILKLVNFKTDGYDGNSIKIYANTTDKNITAPKARVFSIRDIDVTVNFIESK